MGLISRVSSRTYRYFLQIISKNSNKNPKMKVKGDLKEYQIIGRKLPSAMDPNPQIYKMQIFAPDTVAAKSRFWYFVSFYKKVNKTAGEIIECNEVFEKHPGSVKNYGVWIRYDSRSTTEQMYRDMAARHRARPGSIQILKTARVEAKDCRRPQNQAMHKPDIKFPLPRRVISKKQQTARKFNTSRPTTVY